MADQGFVVQTRGSTASPWFPWWTGGGCGKDEEEAAANFDRTHWMKFDNLKRDGLARVVPCVAVPEEK